MDEKKARTLLQKYINGQCDPEESRKLEAWIEKFERSGADESHGKEASAQLERIRAQLEQHTSLPPRQIRSLTPRYGRKRAIATVAAAVLVFSAVTAALFRWSGQEDVQDTKDQQGLAIAPGSNRAMLTLANGDRLDLEDAAIGDLASQAGVRIEKSADGQIRYSILPGAGQGESLRNRIETPRGGQFQIRLPDGTQVWLNAASSLEFFTAGTPKGERRVTLIGEAYFEVEKNESIPFFVETADQEIRVWGTHFNVNAYPDEADTKTTLLEGSVSIQPTQPDPHGAVDPVFLRPGQQARISSTGETRIERAYTEAAAAWKNGYFLFDNEPIEQIMRKIARWYDIDVTFRNINKEQVFSGTVSRFDDISKVLEKLEMTGGVRFTIETGNASGKGRRVIVMP